MIHVCFPLHDLYGNYSKYEGAAIGSLLENTKSKVTIHLLHDETLSEKNKRMFYELVSNYDQKIILYEIDTTKLEMYKSMCGSITIGTLFRLKIPEILSVDISKVIYLDADLIFNIDVERLWKIDLSDKIIAGCLDLDVVNDKTLIWACDKGIIPHESYINAGVLILDLKTIREKYKLEEECLAFLNKYPQCNACDQDALNYVFKDKIKIINGKYNFFTRHVKGQKKITRAVYHYSGVFINYETPDICDQLFLSYLIKTPWGNGSELMNIYNSVLKNKINQIKIYQKIIFLLTQNRKKIIFWGAGSVLLKQVIKIISIDKERDYCIDNNEKIQGMIVDDLKVYHPSKIRDEKKSDFLIVVLSKKYYTIIASQLNKMNLKEFEDYVDGRLLLIQNQGGYLAHK